MSRSSTLVLLGVITILSPLSGLPMALRTLITIASGVAVLTIGIIMRTREVESAVQHRVDAPPEPEADTAPEMSPI